MRSLHLFALAAAAAAFAPPLGAPRPRAPLRAKPDPELEEAGAAYWAALDKRAERKAAGKETRRGNRVKKATAGPPPPKRPPRRTKKGAAAPKAPPRARGLGAQSGAAPLPPKPRGFDVKNLRTTRFVGGYDESDVPYLGLPEVAFIGRSNVGKSSLLNCLTHTLGGERALVSKTPGRTQRVNLYAVADTKGECLVLADLPGYGFAKMSAARQKTAARAIETYLEGRDALALVLVLVDARRGPQDEDVALAAALLQRDVQFAVVATKMDKLQGAAAEATLEEMEVAFAAPALPFSSLTGLGKSALWELVREASLAFAGRPAHGAAAAEDGLLAQLADEGDGVNVNGEAEELEPADFVPDGGATWRDEWA